MASIWWTKREAQTLAEQGDFERAYEALLKIVPADDEPLPRPLSGVSHRAYAKQLEKDIIEMEGRNESLKDALEECRGELQACVEAD
jgi:hypothetical protein